MKRLKILIAVILILTACNFLFRVISKGSFNPNSKFNIGQPLDSLNGVLVYYNAMVGHTDGRNVAPDGYNLGMKYQCVEFVKRYYYQRLNHKMTDSYGNAKDFFDASLPDSSFNIKRGLWQFTNGSKSKPRPEDLLIFDGHTGNPFGHVAIISTVTDTAIIIIQQNPGPFASSRDTFALSNLNNKWTINFRRALGWLRKDTVIVTNKP